MCIEISLRDLSVLLGMDTDIFAGGWRLKLLYSMPAIHPASTAFFPSLPFESQCVKDRALKTKRQVGKWLGKLKRLRILQRAADN